MLLRRCTGLESPRVIDAVDPGTALSDALPDDFRGPVIINGRQAADPEYRLRAGDCVVLIDPIAGPTAAAGAALAVVGTSLQIAFSPRQDFGPGELPRASESGTLQPGGVRNTRGGGFPIQFLYGEQRIGGHVIDFEERQPVDFQDYANTSNSILETVIATVLRGTVPAQKAAIIMRTGLGLGPFDSLTNVEIDGNDPNDLGSLFVDTSTGDRDAAALTFLSEVEATESVNTRVSIASGAITHTTTIEIDAFEATVRFPNGMFRDSGGIFLGARVEMLCEYRENGSGAAYTKITGGNVIIKDRLGSPVTRRWRVDRLPRAKYDIRMTRITADDNAANDPNASQGGEDESWFHEVTTILDESRAHPGIAQVAVKSVQTDSLGEEPRRPTTVTVLAKGFNDVRVYSTPQGGYSLVWSDNPAWCTAHFIAGQHGMQAGYAKVHIEKFFDWASYCDELVDDGRGGTEPRCQLGHYQDIPEDAKSVRARLATAGDAVVIFDGARWKPVIDRKWPERNVDDTPKVRHVFDETNIKPGSLRYTWLPTDDLPTSITGAFINKEIGYRRDSLVQEDDAAVDSGRGHVEDNVQLFGIQRPSQVARTLKRMLNTAKYAVRQVDFITNLEGFLLEVGDIIGLSTTTAGLAHESGEILRIAKGGERIYLDRMARLQTGESYWLHVSHRSDSSVETKPVSTASPWIGDYVEVSGAWDQPVQLGDRYCLSDSVTTYELFRVERLTLERDYRRRVRARLYDDRIYDESTISNPDEDTDKVLPASVIPSEPTFSLREIANTGDKHIGVSIDEVAEVNISHWRIYVRRNGDNDDAWRQDGITTTRFYVTQPVDASTSYDVNVVAVAPSGHASPLKDANAVTIAIGA